MVIHIKQSDLIFESKSINERYIYRQVYLNENLFNIENIFDFYSSLNSIIENCSSSPLKQKLNSLVTLVVAKLFVTHELCINEISKKLLVLPSVVSWHLLIFFSDIYSDRFMLNNFFQVDDLSSSGDKRDIKNMFNVFGEKRSKDEIFLMGRKVELRNLLESPGWDDLIKNSTGKKNSNATKSQKIVGMSFRMLLSYLTLVSLMMGLLFFALKINEINEIKLLSKINLPSRFFTWLDNNEFNQINMFSSNQEFDSENLSTEENPVLEKQIEDDRFDVESDVILTSLDQIDSEENSALEEIKKGQFRDSRYGNRKVYRLMITSADIIEVSEKLGGIMKKHQVIKGGTVEPGSQLPGGLYYNLLVPTERLKNFFSEIDEVEDMNIYLSKSRMFAPSGKSNVFIWVKKI